LFSPSSLKAIEASLAFRCGKPSWLVVTCPMLCKVHPGVRKNYNRSPSVNLSDPSFSLSFELLALGDALSFNVRRNKARSAPKIRVASAMKTNDLIGAMHKRYRR
jgi:hypothetical protein